VGWQEKVRRTKAQVSRFAVGSPDHIESFVWRCWTTGGNDVYVGVRDALRFFKVSLHQSGVWRIAFVKELELPDRSADRVILRWQRPAEVALGLTAAVNIYVTSVQPQQPLHDMVVDSSTIVWTDSVPGHSRVFSAFFAAPGVSKDDVLRLLAARANVTLVCDFGLPNGQTFLIASFTQPVGPDEIGYIRNHQQKLAVRMKHGSDPAAVGMRLISIKAPDPASPLGGPTIFEIGIGAESVTIDPPVATPSEEVR
jgi:hypothetical protein